MDVPAVDDRDDLVPPPHGSHQAQVLDGALHRLQEDNAQEGLKEKCPLTLFDSYDLHGSAHIECLSFRVCVGCMALLWQQLMAH